MKKGIKRISGLLAGCAVFLLPVRAFAAAEEETMREKLGFAAQNTVVGIVTVFLMLLLIALIIYLFRFLPKLVGFFQRKDSGKSKEQQKETVNAAAPPPVDEWDAASMEAEQTQAAPPEDDAELIAVITAAIAAARAAEEEQIPAGSFVVRTIKKRA